MAVCGPGAAPDAWSSRDRAYTAWHRAKRKCLGGTESIVKLWGEVKAKGCSLGWGFLCPGGAIHTSLKWERAPREEEHTGYSSRDGGRPHSAGDRGGNQ